MIHLELGSRPTSSFSLTLFLFHFFLFFFSNNTFAMLELFQLSKQQREFLENYRETESLFLLREEKKASFSRFLPPLTPTTRSFSKLCIFLFTTSLVPSFVRFTLPPPLFLRNRSRCSRRRFLLRIETYGKIRGSEKGPILLLVLPLLLSIFFLDSFRSIIGLIR